MQNQHGLTLEEDEKLVIIGGGGNIGRELISRLTFNDKIVGILGSNVGVLKEGGIDRKILEQIINSSDKQKARDVIGSEGSSYHSILNAISFLQSEGIKPIVIDVSNGPIDHLSLRQKGIKISTANKVPLSTGSYDDFSQIVGSHYGSETTVMAGQGIVSRIEREKMLGNQITSIQGVFSGTLGFIMSELSNGKKISEAIRIAIEKGYTEPNPMDDLDGLDVAKKLVICARYAGFDVNLDDINVKGLLDDSYRKFFPKGFDATSEGKQEAVNTFLEEVRKNEDEKFIIKVRETIGAGNIFCFLAELDNRGEELILKVGPRDDIDYKSSIGGLEGTENIALLQTNKSKVSIIGAGAGVVTTANSTLMNLNDILLRK